MKVIKATQQMLETRTLVLGFQGENLRTQLRIDCAATFAEYPNATPALAIKPPSGATYPVFVERDGNEVVWDIVANNLILKGDGELQLTFYKDNVIAKTVIGTIRVNRSLQIDGEMPDVVATWIENANRKLAEVDAQIVELEGMVDTATDAATRAEQSASTASTKAEQAAGSAATATEKATEATNAAGTATAKAAEAQTAAQTATNKANAAAESERIATAKAVETTTAAGTATTKAEQATEAAQTATEKARDASASATAAHASEINAAESADGAFSAEVGANAAKRAAETSATQAGISEQNAGIAAQTATQKAAEATQSATNAAIFAGTATTKAEEAAESAQAASDAQTAVEQTAEQLADSLEQIDQNTQDIAELEERKANVDGYYPDMTVGNAEQLNSSKFVENSEPYTLRTSGGSSDIGNREYVDAVVGGTLAWNQAVRDGASENSTDFADVVTVTDAVEDAAGVKVKLEPVQDLHGYENPWPAGGGKNILPYIPNTGENSIGVTVSYDTDNEAYVLNGTTNIAGNIVLSQIPPNLLPISEDISTGTRILSVRVVSGSMTLGTGDGITYAVAIFNSSNNNYIRGGVYAVESQLDGYYGYKSTGIASTGNYLLYFQIWRTGTVFNNLKIRIQLEEASSTTAAPTAWTPYSNICPITGWDGATVSRTGKNLSHLTYVGGGGASYTDLTDNAVTVYSNTSSAVYRYARFELAELDAFRGKTVNFSCNATNDTGDSTPRTILRITDADYNLVGSNLFELTMLTISRSFTIPSSLADGCKLVAVLYSASNDTGEQRKTWSDIQLELGSTATAYEPYAGQTYDITLPTEAGTVYGGELTVNADGSGSLVVDRATVTVSSASGNANVLNNTVRFRVGNLLYQNWYLLASGKIISNMLTRRDYATDLPSFSHGDSSAAVFFKLPLSLGLTTIAQISEWLTNNPIQLCYPLENPITYTLTASQIRTLLGTNNVWADAGQLALTYTGTDEHLTLESGKKYLTRLSGTDSMLLGSGQEITAAKGTDNVFDLTQMFGSAVADYVYGQGAAFFRKWFPNAVYPYNAGELRHVEGLQSHDMVGFNLWDGEYEGGYYDTVDGEAKGNASSTTSWQKSKNPIPCLPNTQYCYSIDSAPSSGSAGYLLYYDASGNYLNSYVQITSVAYRGGHTFTTPDNCYFVKFYNNISWFLKNNCISLAHNGSRNGEYEPYEKHSYPLDSTVVLRGIPKVGANGVYWDGDRYLPDGTVERRYGVVDLGSFNWQYNSNYHVLNSTGLPANAKPGGFAFCAQYVNGYRNTIEKSIVMGQTGWFIGNITVTDSSYTDPVAFKAAMQGVMFVYELAEPTYETAQPYHSTQWVSDWGTEEFVSTGIVPVGTETRYPANLRDKLQHLPDAASGNGSYLITQTDGQMMLTPFPAPPSTAGNYVLKATVTNGVATYTWEVAT